MIPVDAICWALAPPDPPLESVDLLGLTDDDLGCYACDLQLELDAVRQLLHAAIRRLPGSRRWPLRP